jgi:hypothetical protein
MTDYTSFVDEDGERVEWSTEQPNDYLPQCSAEGSLWDCWFGGDCCGFCCAACCLEALSAL